MKKEILVLVAILITFTWLGQAQNQTSKPKDYSQYPYWQEMMMDPSVNFFETQKAFYSYWKDRQPTRGNGYKVFKRWEYYWQTRVNAQGEFPAAGKVYQEFSDYQASHPVDGRLKSGNPEWMELGPKTRVNYGGYVGVGRVNAIAFHPTDTSKLYIGAPAGGFWYSHDSGATWATSTDELPTLGVSAILLNSENPELILIGTGDDDGGNAMGLGTFRSTDGGMTWTQSNEGMGNQIVSAFAQNENDPNTVLAAAKNGGIFKTTDFGLSWTKTSAPNSEFRELKYKPGDMSVAYASSNGFYRSEDGGMTWTQIGADEGLTATGRMVFDVTPANDSLVYILVGSGGFDGLFQSRDFGKTFSLQSDSPNILGWSYEANDDGSQAWYDLIIHADHVNPDLIHIGGVNLWKSSNGGKNWTITGHWWGDRTNAVHADQHHFAFNPLNNRLYNGNDGGVYWTDNQGAKWTEVSEGLGIGQMYKLGVSLTDKGKSIAGFQDNGTATRMGTNWLNTGGGDGMECAVDPFDAAYSYSTVYYGSIERRINNGSTRNIAAKGNYGITEDGAWVTPFLIGENDPNLMVIGYKNVWICRNVRTNSDPVWKKISNNLGGRNDVNGRVLEHSPADFGILYYVRDDGMIFRTDNLLDPTPVWNNLTSGKPTATQPTDLECHPTDPNIVYMTSGNQVFKSINRGSSWVNISGSLPDIPMNDICFDKTSNEGLYLATDAGVYYKDADQEDWALFGTKLPVSVEISELEIYYDRQTRSDSRIRVSTFGRGMWETGLAETNGMLPPTLLQATAGTGLVELQWEAPFYSQAITGYNIYRNDLLIGSSTGTSYLDRDVENEFTYVYFIKAVYGGTNESQASNEASATPIAEIELPYNQDFEKGNAGWTAKYAFDGWQYGNSEELKVTGNTGKFFAINSGMAGAGIHVTDYLSTPKIDLSPYAGQTVNLKFRYTIRKYMDYDHLFLVYKTPEGDRWNILEELPKPSGFGWPWGEKEMEVPADWLVKDLQIAFFYDDSNEHGWGAGVDDFQLFINATSIFDLELASKVSVYPNPSQGKFELSVDQPESGNLSIQVLDMTGREVYMKTYNSPGSLREEIDLTQNAKGIYSLIVKNGPAYYQMKLTIQ